MRPRLEHTVYERLLEHVVCARLLKHAVYERPRLTHTAPTMSARHSLLLLAVALLAAAPAGCTVDTELGLAAEVSAATLLIDPIADTYEVRVTVDFRVGDNATGVREFVPLRVDADAAGEIGTASSFSRPVGFTGMLAPGESRSVTFVGECLGGCNALALCSAGTTAPIDFFWEDRGVSPPELGQTSGVAVVDCTP